MSAISFQKITNFIKECEHKNEGKCEEFDEEQKKISNKSA